MTISQSKPFEPRLICLVVASVLACTTSCMLQDFDKLGPGHGRVAGAAGKGGGGRASGGTTSTSNEGGTTGNSGAAGQSSGNGGSGGMPPTSGGAGGTSATSGGSGGTPATNGGATTSSAGAAGEPVTDPRCPGYAAPGGVLLTPPSSDFETDGTWTTVTAKACTRTASSGSTDGCQGGYYLTCSTRKAAFDGPQFTVPAASLFAGRRYYVTALARYSPATAPTDVGPLVVTANYRCLASTQQSINLGTTQFTTSDWVRVGGLLPAITCDASSLDSLYFSVQTLTTKPAPAYYEPLDVDDFRVFDLN